MQVTIPNLALGGMTIPDAVFFVRASNADFRNGIEGLFAPELLGDVDVELDFSGRRLNVFSQHHCTGHVVYWTATLVTVVPFHLDNDGHISFTVKLDGKRIRRAVLDTGAPRTTLALDLARRRFKIDVKSPDVQKIGEISSQPIYLHQFKSLAFGGVEVGNPTIELWSTGFNVPQEVTGSRAVLDRSGMLPETLIGMDVLRALHIYIAYGQHKLYITAASPPPAAASAPVTNASRQP